MVGSLAYYGAGQRTWTLTSPGTQALPDPPSLLLLEPFLEARRLNLS